MLSTCAFVYLNRSKVLCARRLLHSSLARCVNFYHRCTHMRVSVGNVQITLKVTLIFFSSVRLTTEVELMVITIILNNCISIVKQKLNITSNVRHTLFLWGAVCPKTNLALSCTACNLISTHLIAFLDLSLIFATKWYISTLNWLLDKQHPVHFHHYNYKISFSNGVKSQIQISNDWNLPKSQIAFHPLSTCIPSLIVT